jgi:squalene synthase HpnC
LRINGDIEINDNLINQGEAYSRDLVQSHYENFSVAARILPRQKRQDLYNIYTFCRLADDFADNAISIDDAGSKLHNWELSLEAAASGDVNDPFFNALGNTIRRQNLSLEPFKRLLQAFRLDLIKNRYATRRELSDYTHLSANPVGTIVLELYGYKNSDLFALSDKICTALQLANHWQDVAEDYDRGRIYIPLEDMQRHGVDERTIADKDANTNFRALVKDEVDFARTMFAEGKDLIFRVNGWLRLQLGLYFEGGMSALSAIERNNYDVLNNSSKLRKFDKLAVLFRSSLYLFPRKIS